MVRALRPYTIYRVMSYICGCWPCLYINLKPEYQLPTRLLLDNYKNLEKFGALSPAIAARGLSSCS